MRDAHDQQDDADAIEDAMIQRIVAASSLTEDEAAHVFVLIEKRLTTYTDMMRELSTSPAKFREYFDLIVRVEGYMEQPLDWGPSDGKRRERDDGR